MKALRQLEKRNYIQNDPTLQHNKLVSDTINPFRKEKLLPNNIANGSSTTNPRTEKRYMSPKVHKPNNPGRPVISSVEHFTISHFTFHTSLTSPTDF